VTRSITRETDEPRHDGASGGDRQPTMFLLVREAAEIMRMDDSTLYRHLRSGRFPAVKVGGRYLVPASAVSQMADEALASGQCVVVDEWAARWHERRAADALRRGMTNRPAAMVPIDGTPVRGSTDVRDRPRPGANQTGAGSPITRQGARGDASSMTDRGYTASCGARGTGARGAAGGAA
jgi:excisionase family DNA binding protein